MGILEDAIREHLELKKRHGADPSEVSRLEQEALSPAVREPTVELDEPRSRDEEVAERAHDADTDGPDAGLFDQDERARPSREATAAPASEAPARKAAPEREETAPDADDLWADDDEADEEELAEPAAEVQRAAPPPPGEADTEEPTRVHRPPPPAPATSQESGKGQGDGEDVLEQTPEFLEETPEHDRLWFEQKPPRDFDFDD